MTRGETKPLRELCDPARSISYGIVQPGRPTTEGVPIVRVNNFSAAGLDLSSVLRVEPAIEVQYKRSRPKPGDVLITLVGSIGQVAIAPPQVEGWNLARAVGLIPTADEHHSQWIALALRASDAQAFIRRNANTTVQATFNLKDLAQLPIPYPSRKIRDGILSILTPIDDKIELNRRMNETLEAMAQAIFRDWFVDFGPVRRKQAGAVDPVEIMGGLIGDPARAAELAGLFPRTSAPDGLPQGWNVESLDQIATLTKGRSYKSSELQPSNVALVTLKSFARGGGYRRDGLKPYTGTYKAEQVIGLGDIVLSQTDVTQAADIIGRPAIVSSQGEFETLVASLDVAIIRPKQLTATPREYLYQCLHDRRFTEHALAHVTGTTVLHLSKKAFPSYQVASPPGSLPHAYEAICGPFREKILGNDLENRTLAEARDYLLPRLMSGEVRVGSVSQQEVTT